MPRLLRVASPPFAVRFASFALKRLTLIRPGSRTPRTTWFTAYDADDAHHAEAESRGDARVHGDFRGRVKGTSLYTSAALHPRITGTTLLGLAAVGVGLAVAAPRGD